MKHKKGNTAKAPRRTRYVAALLLNAGAKTEAVLDTTQIAAVSADNAIKKATQWATRWLKTKEIDLATLQVTRNGRAIKTLRMETRL
jgi:hypothetical protein